MILRQIFAGLLRDQPAWLPRLLDGLRRRRGTAWLGPECKSYQS